MVHVLRNFLSEHDNTISPPRMLYTTMLTLRSIHVVSVCDWLCQEIVNCICNLSNTVLQLQVIKCLNHCPREPRDVIILIEQESIRGVRAFCSAHDD